MSVSIDPEKVEIRAIRDLVDFRHADVLEVGCGDGRVTRRYTPEAASVLAIDVNEVKIAETIDKNPTELDAIVKFEVGDITTAEIPGDPFDVAVLSHSL